MRYLMVLLLICFSAPVMAQQEIAADQSAARILAYFRVGQDDVPSANVTRAQFESHLKELQALGATVLPLDTVMKAFKNNAPLPPKTVVITFDGHDKSILTVAAPLLQAHKYPFTVLLSPATIKDKSEHHLSWEDITKLNKSSLVSFGLQAITSGNKEKSIRSDLNNDTFRLRDKIGLKPKFLSFFEGDYTSQLIDITKRYGFTAMLGQNSGVAYAGAPDMPLPRFVMTEDFADLDRFRMVINSLPLPVKDITPTISHINESAPSIGFTLDDDLATQSDQLTCFAAGQDKPTLETLGSRVEVRLASAIDEPRFRVNCTMAVKDSKNPEILYWRWLGLLFIK